MQAVRLHRSFSHAAPVPLPRPARPRPVHLRASQPSADPAEPAASGCPFAQFMDPPVTKRSLLEQLTSLSADTFDTQSSILQGHKAARAPYMFVDAVLVGDAELAKELYAKGSAFDVDFPPHMFDILGRDSMGAVDEPEHMQVRKLVAPSFTASEIERYLPTVQQMAERFCACWAAAGAVPSWQDEIKLFTFEVIVTVVAGINWNDKELREMSGLFAQVTAALGFPITLPIPFSPYTRGLAARAKILGRLQEQIDRCRAAAAAAAAAPGSSAQGGAGAATGVGRPCLLESWVAARDEQGRGLSDTQLQDNLVGLLVAGHDTTSSTLSIVLAYLAKHPEVQRRVREEQLAVAAQHGPALTPAAMAAMPYTEAVVREAWRTHPVVPVSGRRVGAAGPTTLGPFKLQPGQSTWVGLNHILKTDPRWKDATGDLHPSRFNPDRFMTPEGHEQGAQLVFGAGTRSCLGERLAWTDLKVMLAVLMRRYAFELAGDAAISGFPFPVARMDCASFKALPATE